jgi:hypothetical protein
MARGWLVGIAWIDGALSIGLFFALTIRFKEPRNGR